MRKISAKRVKLVYNQNKAINQSEKAISAKMALSNLDLALAQENPSVHKIP